MKIVFVSNAFGAQQGGIGVVVEQMYLEMQRLQVPCELISTRNFKLSKQKKYSTILTVFFSILSTYDTILYLLRNRKSEILIFQHGLFLTQSLSLLVANNLKIPFAIMPHGSLMPRALARKTTLKKIIFEIIERFNLSNAKSIVVCSTQEKEALRKLVGVSSSERIHVIPNGLERSFNDLEIVSVGERHKTFGFLGRLHPIKGLERVVKSVKLCETSFRRNGFKVVIAGPDELGTKSNLQDLSEKLGIADLIDFHKSVYGKEKIMFLSNCKFTILPSYSENFGISVLESLACGTPVVAALETPWAILEEKNAGLWTDCSPRNFASVLESLIEMSNKRYVSMSKSALVLSQNYRWEEIISQLLNTFIYGREI